MFALFTHNPPPQHRRPIIEYVGRALSMSMSTHFSNDEDQDSDAGDMPNDSPLASIDALLEAAKRNAWLDLVQS